MRSRPYAWRVRSLRGQLVGRHAKALEEGRIGAEPEHPRGGEHDEAARHQPEPRAHDLDQAGARAQRGEHGEHAEERQGRVEIGVGSAEHDAPGGEEELEAVEPEPHGLQGEADLIVVARARVETTNRNQSATGE